MDDMGLVEIIKGTWFKDHKATLAKHGDLEVLDWKEPGTGIYYVRYVFDGFKMYVSGDMGTAVFRFTGGVNVHSFEKTCLHYFEEKLEAYHEDRKSFNGEKAVEGLEEWLKDLEEDEIEFEHEGVKELIDGAKHCRTKRGWVEVIEDHVDLIETIDLDYWEWMYDIGDETPARVASYLVGLQMASEQLNKKEDYEK